MTPTCGIAVPLPLLSSPLTLRTPTSVEQIIEDWNTGEAAVEEVLKKMNLSPVSPTPGAIHRTFGTPSSAIYATPQTPSRFISAPIRHIAFDLPKSAPQTTPLQNPFASMAVPSQE
ncbi:hypothetical protein ACHAPI_011471, partial [Fusarium lateritium]